MTSADILPFDGSVLAPAQGLQRTHGSARIAYRNVDGEARLDRFYQSGAAKIRIPRMESGEPPQAVLINSAGGLTGGDSLGTEIALDRNCRLAATSQACEKIYRASSGTAEIETSVSLAQGARLDWLPQETILFDRARLARRFRASLAEDARLLALESVIFGRRAMGEAVTSGSLKESWRVHRGGRLVFADETRFDGPVADLLRRPAVLDGAAAIATMLYVAPDAFRVLQPAREAIGPAGGASAWNGMLVARLVAVDGAALRRLLVRLLPLLLDGKPLPTIWRI
jgi:urease accessory protein